MLIYLFVVALLFLSKSIDGKNPRIPTTADRQWQVSPIGKVQSPYIDKLGTPKQATISVAEGGAQDGTIELFPGYEECITSLEGFDYIWVISYMHLNRGFKTKILTRPRVGSKMTPVEVGLFSSRAPHRPNPLALSALQLIGI